MRKSLVEALSWVALHGRSGQTFRRREFDRALSHRGKRTRNETWSDLRSRGIVVVKDKLIQGRGRPVSIYAVDDVGLASFLVHEGVLKPALRRLRVLVAKDQNAFGHPVAEPVSPPAYVELCADGELSSLIAFDPSVRERVRRWLIQEGRSYDHAAVLSQIGRLTGRLDLLLRESSSILFNLLGTDKGYAVVLGPAVIGAFDERLFDRILGRPR